MKKKIKNVAVIGTGVIGTGWIIRLLIHGKKVYAYDIKKNHKINLIKNINRTWQIVKKLFYKKKKNINNLVFSTSIKDVVKNADFIQECAPENQKLKIKILKKIELFAKKNNASK